MEFAKNKFGSPLPSRINVSRVAFQQTMLVLALLCLQDVKCVIRTRQHPMWCYHGPTRPWTRGYVTPTQPDLCLLTPTELTHNVATPTGRASVDGESPLSFYNPMGCVAPCHDFNETSCTAPCGTSLVTMPFIIQSNHRFACLSGWKDELGCCCLSLRRLPPPFMCLCCVE